MRPNQTFHVVAALRPSAATHLRRKGVELSLDDSQTVVDVYQQWILLAMDLGYLLPDTLSRDAARLLNAMFEADVYDLNSAFAECLHLVRVQTSRGFKGLCKRISPHLYNLVKGDIELMSQGDVFAARRLVQLFSYTGRLSLNDIDLTQQLLDDYMSIEVSILDDYDNHLTDALNKIIKRWFGSTVPEEIFPQHGPGGVAGHGRASLEVKYKDLTTDARIEYAFGDPWWLPHGGIRSTMDRISSTIFVPKSYKTFRTISMEPTTLQYLQQGVWKVIDSSVRSNHYLASHIDFHDQERNKSLAKEGSIDRNYATLDLSSASDSVSYSLVKKLFRGTWLHRYLVALRSTRTMLPDGRVIDLKKFAPMGSSLCFPIETIVFASICEYVTKGRDTAGRYSVYGDDIIVPTQCAAETMDILTSLGFYVNRSKSFFDSACWFRESCGGEYCDGFDVTPMRISRKYASRERCVRLAKLVELANNAYVKGYRNLRYFFLDKLRQANYVPLFAPSELLADNYTNYHAKQRWNKVLQRIDVRVTTQSAKFVKEDLSIQDESLRYRHWLESTAERSYFGNRYPAFRSRKREKKRPIIGNKAYIAEKKLRASSNAMGDGFESVICRPIAVTKETWRMKPYEDLDQAFIDSNTGMGKSSS